MWSVLTPRQSSFSVSAVIFTYILFFCSTVRCIPPTSADIYSDQISLDAHDFSVVANLSTTTLATKDISSPPLQGPQSHLLVQGVFFLYDPVTLPALINDVDHIAIIPISDTTHGNEIVQDVNHPRIKAGILYPASPAGGISTIRDIQTSLFASFLATNAVGTQISRQLMAFHQGVAYSDQAVANARPQNDTNVGPGRDWSKTYYRRLWGRIRYGDCVARGYSGPRKPNTALIVAITVPLLMLTLAVLAPGIIVDQIGQLSSVTFTEDVRFQFRYCTIPAIQRFKNITDSLSTSSDEESDSDGDEPSLSVYFPEKTRYLDDAGGTGPASLVFTSSSDVASGGFKPPANLGGYRNHLGTGDPVALGPLSSPNLPVLAARDSITMSTVTQVVNMVSAKRPTMFWDASGVPRLVMGLGKVSWAGMNTSAAAFSVPNLNALNPDSITVQVTPLTSLTFGKSYDL
ncbi:hypothetical protein IWQ60_009925 [Tieghemiomyces parasiticus]|uniref:Transmembrane protein n=1 Tax=Tieghemiomyces parasiticus TaxID=78921 RepID=A0A9W8DJ52_9FUNG|nr:hypothetical protein IWQ60_009925 [Tieghemiomyces parasiticus]